MPIYEYICKNCEVKFEVFQKITDEPLKTCKTCGNKVKKIISQTSFRLIGDGWYISDKNKTE